MSKQLQLYVNKVEEQNSLSLVATLVFGFSITMLVETDETLFITNELIAYIFGLSLIIVIVCSALSTLILMGTSFIFRRYMFRQSLSSLETAKTESLYLRLYARKMIYVSFIGSFISLGAYGHAKWQSTNYDPLYIISYIVLAIGFGFLGYIWYSLKKINQTAFNKLQSTNTSHRKLATAPKQNSKVFVKQQSH